MLKTVISKAWKGIRQAIWGWNERFLKTTLSVFRETLFV
jgi:hypothetical protein